MLSPPGSTPSASSHPELWLTAVRLILLDPQRRQSPLVRTDASRLTLPWEMVHVPTKSHWESSDGSLFPRCFQSCANYKAEADAGATFFVNTWHLGGTKKDYKLPSWWWKFSIYPLRLLNRSFITGSNSCSILKKGIALTVNFLTNFNSTNS